MPSLSYAHGIGPTPLLAQTIGDNLRATVERFPERDALVICHQGFRANYRQLWELTTRAAKALLALDVAPGDRVGIWATNCYEWVVVQYATARIGAILVNVNPAYPGPELEYSLRQSGVTILAHGERFRQSEYGPMLDAVRPRCPELRWTLPLATGWDEFLGSGERVADASLAVREQALQFDDPINVQYTSGTTGHPKGATLTHHNILNNGFFVGAALGYTELDRVLLPVPFYHCFGMVMGNLACTAHGSCMVVPGEYFQPATVLAAVENERCTSIYGVPTMFRAILEDPAFVRTDCTSLRTGIMAGAPCPVELMRLVRDKLHVPEIAICYGMTETSPVSTMSARDDPLERRVGTVGRVMPHVEISVRDPVTRAVLPRGESGELCTRGHTVMRGYWHDETATRAAIDPAGWMHSGDLAVLDEEGYLHIVGRIKDMIIRGGENVSPREIENVLLAHHRVSEAQVIGVPSVKYGEEVMAWVRPIPGEAVTEEDLCHWCSERLARFKVPRYWRFVDAFPMTVTGKIQKYRLREMAVELLGLHHAAAERMA
jgi:fatty-acyl-CoA synthase